MISGAFGSRKSNTLMNEYSSLLSGAVLRQRMRMAEQSAQVESELANKVKSEFVSNMSHELRTPLNTVIGFSKILAEQNHRQVSSEDVIEYANLIHDAAVHLLAVINDILDISKIQSGRYTLDARELDIKSVLLDQVTAFEADAKTAGVALVTEVDSHLPLVRGDSNKLSQVFANVLSNAIKFTHPGGQVKISATRLKDEAVAIFISDTGVGMSPDELEIAKQPFGQVDGSRTRWREGTGLGIPITQSLVELHGGEFDIRSQKDHGTEVTILLPSRHVVSAAQARRTVL
ncbi:MAG: HAMP domain-containing histidine kinase [Alphaproteobacteria bacterium]|nr:HAMP domain-containing histidine kinase [Alphaproteobacteria bacterium]